MLARKIYMKDIQSEWVRKHSVVNNILNKKNRIECSAISCDWADRFSSQLWADHENQNIAEFISQNDILWVSWL